MRSFVTVRGLVWNPQYSRPEFPPRLTPSVVKGFVMFGGFEHVKAFALVFLGSPGMPGVRQCRCSVGNGASADDCGEDGGGAEAARLFNLYWDGKPGKLWLEIDKWSSEFLYQSGLPAGIGSNDIGLDRGQLGSTRIVRFERSGPKVLLIQENLEYRAVSNDPDERRAVHDSFAESALKGDASEFLSCPRWTHSGSCG